MKVCHNNIFPVSSHSSSLKLSGYFMASHMEPISLMVTAVLFKNTKQTTEIFTSESCANLLYGSSKSSLLTPTIKLDFVASFSEVRGAM